MIPEAFLIAALSLSPDKLKEYTLFVEFVHRVKPGVDVVLSREIRMKSAERIPFTFDGKYVFIKRGS